MENNQKLLCLVIKIGKDDKMKKVFIMSEIESLEAENHIKEHNKDCVIYNGGVHAAIGGRISYFFTPTGLGMACGVQCACGWSKECTDVSDW